ncbi:hypothetical protein NMY22_g11981 [Coprinellus aureogranulatus]|nr:hypothetical protein NMY22_g11981 [Coprinellus aureogranulatus]
MPPPSCKDEVAFLGPRCGSRCAIPGRPPLRMFDPVPTSSIRICPGRFLADSSVYLTLAAMTALFDISPACDSEGNPVLPAVEYDVGFVRHPKDFKCSIKPRSESVLALVKEAKLGCQTQASCFERIDLSSD